eukprot:Gregarina_sp_Poly_1__1446@NODE_1361_length_4294_cov_148_342796_g911_i0_p3_GENE_NODE_1361_length_4294_cov_148_342796_g911_i0NODE_1361_length_4294_cov_148_342796_g911_i0_p3_ORF_typecomplete_len146_score13_80GMC_oxred_N/PF00732_19/1_5e11FAD_binding_2/PF00890_24/8_8e09Thi4/PF01946_17/6_3e07Lycopene_cycl/PF05834_12/1_1e06FAD_oxidored/PF12831_7/1_8e06DAO/PF01266_24/2_2e06Pyr_redox/PF00070_27/3_4e06Pyr_redox_2/PF07992_14/6_8e06HI0933_like/PF03486_14/1_1e05GIDA/PF01134_22/4_1e05NAD_binding_8/PF13450_6/5
MLPCSLLFVFTTFAFCSGTVEQNKSPKRGLQERTFSAVRDLLNQTFEFSYGSQPKSYFPGPPAFAYSHLLGKTFRRAQNYEEFDFIVVGGGGAGCPLARTLAEAGASVLLIERGKLREDSYLSWDIYGTGKFTPTLTNPWFQDAP